MDRIKWWIIGWSIVVGFYVLGDFIYNAVTIYNLHFLPEVPGTPAISYYVLYELKHLAVIFLYWGIGIIVLYLIDRVFFRKNID